MNCLLCDSEQIEHFFTKPTGERYWQCRHCGCFFLEKEFHPNTQEEFDHYEKHNNDPNDEGYRRYVSPVYEAVLESYGAGARGLDYGSGPGPVLSVMLEEKGLHMDQWDPYYAKDELVLDEEYDFVICSEVAEHLHHPKESWEHMKSLLRPGSKLYVMTCLAPSIESFTDWYYHRDPTHVCFYTEKSMSFIRQLLAFKDVHVTPPRLSVFTL